MRLEWGPYGEYRAEGIELASMPLLHWLRDIWEHTTIISDEVCDAGEMQVVWHPLLRCRGIAWGGGSFLFLAYSGAIGKLLFRQLQQG